MNKKVILCVDDESIILDSLSEQISRNFNDEFEIELAESAEEALEVFEELIKDTEVPLVMSDYIMPGMKGDEFLIKINALEPKTNTILLTGQASIKGISNAINNANLYRFIEKPWNQEDLLLTIKEALKSYNKTNQIEKHTLELEEKVAQRTKELQELNATKDKFFSIIAHDLSSPFNYLIGVTNLLSEGIDTLDFDAKKNLILKLNDSAQSAYDLLSNLLLWGRTQQNMIKININNINLNKLVDLSIKPLLNIALEKNIQIENKTAIDINVFADEYMISTVIRNIVNNAIKFTNNNGTITISAEKNNQEIVVVIKDNGVGIPKEILPKLFDIGENSSSKGTNNESGTGLGLILCKEFVTKNNGKIWVESEEGKGSSFFFTLPLT